MGGPGRGGRGPARLAAAVLVVVAGIVAAIGVAAGEVGIALSVEEGVSVMGGPLRYHMADPSEAIGEEAAPDQVSGASPDGVTGASRLASAGGLQVHLDRGGSATLSMGLEYAHYTFDLDYGVGRADLDVVALRLVAMARLPVIFLRGAPFFTVGFGGYGELVLYDGAALSGQPMDVSLRPVGAGFLMDFHLQIWRFELPSVGGRLVPGLFVRAYRGLFTQLEDELGSSAPLASITLGAGLRYELPRRGDRQPVERDR